MAKKTITNELINQARELARMGLQRGAIAKALGLHPSTLSRNRKLSKALPEGENEARREIMANLRGHAEMDAPTCFKLAKETGCFNDPIEVEKPKDAKEALGLLGDVIVAYAEGRINETKAKTLQSLTASFVRCYKEAVIEERVAEIEKMLDMEDDDDGEV